MVMSVPPEMWRMGDFSDGPPIYDPRDDAAEPELRSGQAGEPERIRC